MVCDHGTAGGTARRRLVRPVLRAIDDQSAENRIAPSHRGVCFSPPPSSFLSVPGWSECKTPDGKVYYINHVDKSTAWDRPTAAAGVTGADAAAGKLQRKGSILSVVKMKTRKKKDKTSASSSAPAATVPASGNAGAPLPAGACLGGPVLLCAVFILSPLVAGGTAKSTQLCSLRQDVMAGGGARCTLLSKYG